MNKTKIAQLRKSLGLTQESLAEKSYLTVRTIQRIESGEDVSLNSLSAIANALGVPVSQLFDVIDQSEREEEIMTFSQEQMTQIRQRDSESISIKLLLVGFNALILLLFAYWISIQPETGQAVPVILWIFLFFIMLSLSIYAYRIIALNRLDKKYPKTVGLHHHHKSNDGEHEPIQNGWQFLARYWWLIFPIGGFLSWLIPYIIR